MRISNPLSILVLLVSLACRVEAESVRGAQDMQALNIALIERQVIPAYQALGRATQELAQQSAKYCQAPNAQNLALTQEAFHQAMDAWQRIQFIRFGPIETMMRVHSIQFWPDRKQHVSKHLERLLRQADPKALDQDAIYRQPVSVRGLPAIEVLLFNKAPLQGYACDALLAITRVVHRDTETLAAEWQDSMRRRFVVFGEDEFFNDAAEASAKLLGSVLDQLAYMADVKLSGALGPQLQAVRAKQFESWRSGRSLRNLEQNFVAFEKSWRDAEAEGQGLYALFTLAEFKVLTQQINVIGQTFSELKQSTQGMEEQALVEGGFNQLHTLATQLRNLKKQLELGLKAHGVYLGFNSRDGD